MKSYSTYDRDRLDAADKMKIERGIYFDTKGADISPHGRNRQERPCYLTRRLSMREYPK